MAQGPLADLGIPDSLAAIAAGELGPLATLVQALRNSEEELRAQPFVKLADLSPRAKACAVATLVDIDDVIAQQVTLLDDESVKAEYISYILGLRARLYCGAIDSLAGDTPHDH